MLRKWSFLLAGGILVAVIILAFTSEQTYALDENQCLLCHGDPDIVKNGDGGRSISLYVVEETLNTSAHRFIDCTTCHGMDPHKVDSPLTKLSLAEKCGTCHEYQYRLHRESIHGEQLLQGNPDVATCVDCHSPVGNPHSVVRVLEYSAPAYRKNIAETCAKCHGNEELMARYGILEKVYETYTRSFHGKAIQLGTYEISQLDKAVCSNCHGTHAIKAINDPDSPVAGMDHLVKTCEQCHPGAGVEFAKSFLGHKEVSPQESAAVFYAEKFFIALTSSVITFAIIVTALATIRWGLRRWREEK